MAQKEQITREALEANASNIRAQGTARSSADDARSVEQSRKCDAGIPNDLTNIKDDDVEMADTIDTPKKTKMYQYSYNSELRKLAPTTAIDGSPTKAFRHKQSGSELLKVKIVNDSEDVELADPPEA